MFRFSNILVGVDLARCNPLDVAGLTPVAREPIHWGMQLARTSSARLLFFSASNLGEEALLPLAEEDRTRVLESIAKGGNRVLYELIQEASSQGITAQGKLVPGQGWLEIIRQVIRDKHDLVIVGTRDLTALGHILFGNTSIKLMRRCPCPVLVTKPLTFATGILGANMPLAASGQTSPLNILVATNMEPASDEAVRLGIGLAQQMNAHLHVLHVVEYKLDEVCNIGLPDSKQAEYRRKVRGQAQQRLNAQLEKTDYKSLGTRIEIHLAGDVNLPDVAIQRFIASHQIHLLVMGMITKGGIRGIMIGSTAERLLREVNCSVLAVKPPDFVCPVDV